MKLATEKASIFHSARIYERIVRGDSLTTPGANWLMHEICDRVLRNFIWLTNDTQYWMSEVRPEREYLGYSSSAESRHRISLIIQCTNKLACYVAEVAEVPAELISSPEHFIPWITPMDALCIEALSWYYENFAIITVDPHVYRTKL